MEGSDEDEACGKWGHIPPEEQISLDAAAPCMRHLLKR